MLGSISLYIENPLTIDAALRSNLDKFKGRDSENPICAHAIIDSSAKRA